MKRRSSVNGLLISALCPRSSKMPAYPSQMASSQACGLSPFLIAHPDLRAQNLNWVLRLTVRRSEVFCITTGRNGAESCLIFLINARVGGRNMPALIYVGHCFGLIIFAECVPGTGCYLYNSVWDGRDNCAWEDSRTSHNVGQLL